MEYKRLVFLLRLKFRLASRVYIENPVQRAKKMAGLLIGGLFIGLPSIGIAVVCGMLFVLASPPIPERLLLVVLAGIYSIWLLCSLIGQAFDDSLDVTKLALFPLSARRLLTGMTLSSMVNIPNVAMYPLFVAILIGFTRDIPSFLVTSFAILLFFFHILSLGQIVLLLNAGSLHQRHRRDRLRVVTHLLHVSLFVAMYTVWAYFMLHLESSELMRWDSLLTGTLWDVLVYFPPGYATHAIVSGSIGDLGQTTFSFGMLAGVTALTFFLAGWLVDWLNAREPSGEKKKRLYANVKHKDLTSDHPMASRLRALFPVPVLAVVRKEIRYLFREPYFKIVGISVVFTIYMPLLFIYVFLEMGFADSGYSSYLKALVWLSTLPVLLPEAAVVFNLWGHEGSAVSTLFLFPAERKHLLQGKQISLFLIFVPVNLTYAILICLLLGSWSLFLPLALWFVLSFVILLGVGMYVSGKAPVIVVTSKMAWSNLLGFVDLIQFVAFAIVVLPVSLPVLAGVLLPAYWVDPVWYLVSIPLTIVYTMLCYRFSFRRNLRDLPEREQDVLFALSPHAL